MIKIWGKTLKKNKIVKSYMVEREKALSSELIFSALDEICQEFDIERPVMLQKHKHDMEQFLFMKFLPEDFMEKVDFSRFEIEVFVEKKKD